MNSIRDFARRMFSLDVGIYLFFNLILTLILNLYLEILLRKSVTGLMDFIRERTFLFLFNGFLIFTTLSVVLLFKKKIFAYVMAGGSWILVGLVNGLILSQRKTPFTAVDLTIAKSALPIIRSYLTMPQIILAVCLIMVLIGGFVCLFLYSREQKRAFDGMVSFCWILLIGAAFTLCLKIGTGRGLLTRKFDNLIDAYKDCGVAYSFFITAVDTGIDRPLNYSQDSVRRILNRTDRKVREMKGQDRVMEDETRKAEEEEAVTKTADAGPNIIFLQLESFFDPTLVRNLEISRDPLPNLHRMQKEYTHGRLEVPVYGAGTINTEFEVITGMNLDHFGSGEFPFRSILHSRTCDNISYWLKGNGYVSSLVHNNNASFYDRDKVYSNLGFDYFISLENMNVTERNEIGWPKDIILKDQILDLLSTTREKDMIYTVSVQGHGDYPGTARPETGEEEIQVTGENLSDYYTNAWTYYVNQIYEMDDFVYKLTQALEYYPEDVILVVYGDHLPGMNVESTDLTRGNKYETPYVIWDNFGYNRDHAEEESANIKAWQLASKVLHEAKIYDGVLNRYHQTMSKTKKYKKNLRILEYDMLYGSNFVRRLKGKKDLLPSKIQYGIHNPRITGLYQDEESGDLILAGEYFTDHSRVYGDHIRIKSEKLGPSRILIPAKNLSGQKELQVIQVSDQNEKILYNRSDPWAFDREAIPLLPENDPARILLQEREEKKEEKNEENGQKDP